MMTKLPSQMEWKPYGHLICTPVALLAGTALLHTQELSAGYVREIMQLSHNLYSEYFAGSGLPLKIQDLFPYIPSKLFKYTEVAGTITHADSLTSVEAEGMMILPLTQMLEKLVEEAQALEQKLCLIVTAHGHTMCYCAYEEGKLLVFDPLPASLCVVPLQRLASWLIEIYSSKASEEPVLYSALILECICSV